MKNPIKEFFKKRDGVFAVQLFANDNLSLDQFDENHLIFRMSIKGLWKPKPILFRADPFMFVKGDELFLFYELQYGFDPGQIVMMKTKDLKEWTEPIVVLKESFHLSFPFVFEDNGHVYMIPECEKTNTIKLYVANNDLTSFTYVRTLLKQDRYEGLYCNYADSHIYKKDGIYYLFTSYLKDWKQHQMIFYSENLLNGDFIVHPQSPVIINNECGRNGGSILDLDGEIFRVSQDCHKDYGENVSLHKILKVSSEEYEEVIYCRNIYSGNLLFPDGGHQLNIVKFKGKYIYATDYKENRWTWFHLYHSITKHF